MWWRFAQKDKKQPSLFFDPWAEDAVITDPQGYPSVLYHGTLYDFDKFDINKSNPYSQFGPGFYFSNNIDDVNQHYAAPDSQDLHNNIERKVDDLLSKMYDDEQIAQQLSQKYNTPFNANTDNSSAQDQIWYPILKKELSDFAYPKVIPAYVKIKSPAILDPYAPNIYEYDLYDEDTDEDIDAPTTPLMNLVQHLNNFSEKYLSDHSLTDEVFESLYNEFNNYDLYKSLEQSRIMGQIAEDDFDYDKPAAIQEFFKELGYTGFIANAHVFFPHLNLPPDTMHYITFNPHDIKSAIGNNGLYDPNQATITANTKFIKK